MRALIVEDNQIERAAMDKLFDMLYPETFTSRGLASDRRSAKILLEKSYWDLVLLDINLPDGNGIDFIDTIKELRPESEVIMVTAYSDFEYLRQSIRKKAFDYILKPYSVGTFNECLSRYLEKYWSYTEHFGNAKIAQKVYEYLKNNYTKPIHLSDIADYLSLDKSYIARTFKAEFGYGIIEFLIRYRIDKAENLISKGMNVSEASIEVGFNDPAYFGKCFKKIKGYPPKDSGKSILS